MMREGVKYYDMLEKLKQNLLSAGELQRLNTSIERDVIENSERFEKILADDELDFNPAVQVKRRLNEAFENRYGAGVQRNSVIHLPGFSLSSGKSFLVWSLKIAAVILIVFSLKLGFNPEPSFQLNEALLADSLQKLPIDSNQINSDSLSF